MERYEVIYDHYKETCEICRENEKERNRFFIIVCILLAVLFLFMIEETSAVGLLHAWIKEKYDYDLVLSINTIQSLIWILLLYFTIRYYQQSINIERLYQYIHNIEGKISNELNFDIIREGENYLQKYPWVLNFIWIIYTIIFPILYLVLIITKMTMELHTCFGCWNVCLHIIIGICDIILTILYLLFLHMKNIKRILHKESN